MKLALLVYLASTVESVSKLFFLFSLFGLFALISLLMITFASGYGIEQGYRETDEQFSRKVEIRTKIFNYSKYLAPTFLTLCLVSALLPNERTIYLMAGAYATEQIASNERVQKIGSDVLEVIETKLGEMKKEESEEKEAKADAEES